MLDVDDDSICVCVNKYYIIILCNVKKPMCSKLVACTQTPRIILKITILKYDVEKLAARVCACNTQHVCAFHTTTAPGLSKYFYFIDTRFNPYFHSAKCIAPAYEQRRRISIDFPNFRLKNAKMESSSTKAGEIRMTPNGVPQSKGKLNTHITTDHTVGSRRWYSVASEMLAPSQAYALWRRGKMSLGQPACVNRTVHIYAERFERNFPPHSKKE